ncbi:MAG: hypothetical protein ACXAE3_06475 [Candidatus Kariarchaeaceae archaeon]
MTRNGILAGMATSVVFVAIHHILIDPIWFILPMALIFGALTGWGLSASEQHLFEESTWMTTIKTLLLYLIPVILLDVAIALFVDPIFTFEEASDPTTTGTLLGTAFSIVIPYAIVYGAIQGTLLGRSRADYTTSIGTNLAILAGIAHNFPLFNLVEADSSVAGIHLLAFVLLLLLMTSYAILLRLINRITT